jgi:hypothetical protein
MFTCEEHREMFDRDTGCPYCRERTLTAKLEKAEAAQRWIPVSERLPEKGDVVLGWIEIPASRWHPEGYKLPVGAVVHTFDSLATTNGSSGELPLGGQYMTHWMPLPPPPEDKT